MKFKDVVRVMSGNDIEKIDVCHRCKVEQYENVHLSISANSIKPCVDVEYDVCVPRLSWATLINDFREQLSSPDKMAFDITLDLDCYLIVYDIIGKRMSVRFFIGDDPKIHRTRDESMSKFYIGKIADGGLREANFTYVPIHPTSTYEDTRDTMLSALYKDGFSYVCRMIVRTHDSGKVDETTHIYVTGDHIGNEAARMNYIDTDIASARHAEITQLILSSKCLDAEACTKVWDFLYNAAKTALPEGKIGDVSDGYHTFNELYHHRAVLFAALCNLYPDYAWKSKQHDDPNFPMYDGMFICGINAPDGQATYHYDIDPYWDMFDVPELPRAPKFDGHTPAMAIERIRSLNTSYAHPTCTIKFRNAFTDECDKFLLACWKTNSAEYDCHTEFYIDGTESNGNDTFIVPFRFPGATRGHVTINRTSGRVIEVKFYATAYENSGIACYMDTINSLIVEWEGGLMPKLAEYCRMRKHGWVEITTDGCKAR